MKRALLAALSLGLAYGCNEFVSVGGDEASSSVAVASSSSTGGQILHAKRVDLVLAIDNSKSMGDKQALLELALDDLVEQLVNPPCVDQFGTPAQVQPVNGFQACTSGARRVRSPIDDIHIGVVDSSLGGHGSDSCPATSATNDDGGRLVDRLTPSTVTPTGTSYQGEHFLAWDPAQKLTPPGQDDEPTLVADVRQIVSGVGQIGCGYESQLESFYRFVVDPNPYLTIAVDKNGDAISTGTDQVLLQERADFLRPDSLLVVMLLSDEDDCSTKESATFWRSNQLSDPSQSAKPFRMPPARAICATAPDDPCCASCAQATPPGCLDDPTCTDALDASDDPFSLRCFDQKRRFGVDFLYPLDRYVRGLSSPTVPDRDGNVLANPIFTNLDPTDYPGSPVRAPSLVMLEAIVGVPWQDLATDPTDLSQGYRTGADLAARWSVVLGDPPNDPFMIPSIDPRSGQNPITMDPLAPPDAGIVNSINGGERDIPNRDDLQYTCIFKLAASRDCSLDVNFDACDCVVTPGDDQTDNPLCATNDGDGGNHSLQVFAKAYPGTRELGLVKALEGNGVAASICPSQSTHPAALDYAYRPAVTALIAALAGRVEIDP